MLIFPNIVHLILSGQFGENHFITPSVEKKKFFLNGARVSDPLRGIVGDCKIGASSFDVEKTVIFGCAFNMA